MPKHPLAFLTLLVLVFSIAGCDNFNLLDQFSRSGPLSLVLESSSLQQGQTISLYPSGGLPPYTFGILAGNLYYSGTTLGSIDSGNQTFTAGNEVGTVQVLLADSAGTSTTAQATVVPPTPGGLTATGVSTTTSYITLSWSYSNTSIISGFQIWQSVSGGSFTLLYSPAASATSYTDSGLNKNMVYTYELYAVSGSFRSLPAIVSATP